MSTQLYKTGETFRATFSTNGIDGTTKAADSTPTGSVWLNGSSDAASVTIGGGTGGKYSASFALPGSAGDSVTLWITATVDGITSTVAAATIRLIAADVTDGVRLGLTALPNAAFNATGGMGPGLIRVGTAQAGSNLSITLDAGASSVDSFYRGRWICITSGTGAGQVKLCTTYTGSTKVATIPTAWPTNPDNTSGFAILPNAAVDVGMWLNSSVFPTSLNGVPKVDVGYFGGTGGTFASGIPTTNLSAAVYQVVAKEIYGTAGTVWFVSTTGSDSNDGLTWATAFALPSKAASVASAGDLILVGRGTFALGNAVVNRPDYVDMRGAGKFLTTITSTAALDSLGCIVQATSNSRTSGMTIKGIATAGTFQAPFGFNAAAGQALGTNWIGEDLLLMADSDGMYCNPDSATIPAQVRGELIKSEIRTSYDGATAYNANGSAYPTWDCIIDLHDCKIVVDGQTATGDLAASRGLAVSHGRVRMFGGSIVATGGGDYTAAAATLAGGRGASAELYGVIIATSSAWRVGVTSPTGNYTLSVTAGGSTQTTGSIAGTATAATIQSALAALSNVGTGNVYAYLVVGVPTSNRVIVFALAMGVVSVTINTTSITAGTVALTQRPAYDACNASTTGTVVVGDSTGSGAAGTLTTSGTVTVAQSLRPATSGTTYSTSAIAAATAAAVLVDPASKVDGAKVSDTLKVVQANVGGR